MNDEPLEAALKSHDEICTPDCLTRRAHAEQMARVEIAIKRQLLELHSGAHECPELKTGAYSEDWPAGDPRGVKPGDEWRHVSNEFFDEEHPCPTLKLLASVPADRPSNRLHPAQPVGALPGENQLFLGQEYILTGEDGGVMSVAVERFEFQGKVAVLMPLDPAVRAWFRYGHRLAQSQWHSLRPVGH